MLQLMFQLYTVQCTVTFSKNNLAPGGDSLGGRIAGKRRGVGQRAR
eukprot:COSAG02_NODE_43258_length_376_cov_1.144404_1_plen_45_part_10